MDKTVELIEEILRGEEPDTAAYMSAVLRVRGELQVKGGRVCALTADSAFPQVVFDFIGKAKSLAPGICFETGMRGEGKARRAFLSAEGGSADELLRLTRLTAIADESRFDLENDEACLKSFVRGLFAGGGTYVLPGEGERGYYMELRLPDYGETQRLAAALKCRGVEFESAERRADSLLYTRKSEQLCNMLAFMGAGACAVEAYDLLVSRFAAGESARRANYRTGNLDRTVIKSVQQVEAIKFLRDNGCLEEEDAETRRIWQAREENRTLSLGELARLLAVSRSKVARRLEKAIEKAKQKGMEQ